MYASTASISRFVSCDRSRKNSCTLFDGASVEVPSFRASYSSSAYLEPVACFSAFAKSISRIALASRHALTATSLSGMIKLAAVAMATCDCAVISTPSRVASRTNANARCTMSSPHNVLMKYSHAVASGA